MREANIQRVTKETDINLTLNVDGTGLGNIHSGVPFLDHMLELFAKHGHFDLTLTCKGDVQVDAHHSVEDIAICLGTAFQKALKDKKGICRYGHVILPMDESLILVAMDISGRAFLSCELAIPTAKVGTFDTELVEEFFNAFVRHAGVTLHIKKLAGTNAHHIIEGTFKAFAKVLEQATSIDEKHMDSIPSTKGVIE